MRIGSPRLPEDVEHLLNVWQQRLQTLATNLDALGEEFDLQLITSRPDRFRGVTRTQVGELVQTLDKLTEFRDELANVITQAEKIRKELSYWPPERQQQIEEIQRLLGGLTVTVGVTVKDILDRGLLEDATTYQKATPDAALAQMAADLKRAQELVRGISKAWNQVTTFFDTTNKKLAVIEHSVAMIGMSDDPAILALKENVRQLKDDFDADPLSVTEKQLEELRARIWEQNERVETLTRQLASLKGDLQRASEEFRALADRYHSVAPLLAQAAVELRGFQPIGAPVDEQTLINLGNSLESIGAAARAGQMSAAVAGTRRVLDRVAELRDGLEKTRAAIIEARKSLFELSRRIAVRRSQLRDLRAQGKTSDASLEAELTKVEQMIAGRPVSVSACEASARAVEDRIRALQRS